MYVNTSLKLNKRKILKYHYVEIVTSFRLMQMAYML